MSSVCPVLNQIHRCSRFQRISWWKIIADLRKQRIDLRVEPGLLSVTTSWVEGAVEKLGIAPMARKSRETPGQNFPGTAAHRRPAPQRVRCSASIFAERGLVEPSEFEFRN